MIRINIAGWAAGAGIAWAGMAPAVTQDVRPIAAAYGARQYIEQASLSPDGTRVALVVAQGDRGAALLVGNPDTDQELKRILGSSGDPEQLRSCGWVSDARLVCQLTVTTWVDADRAVLTRMIAVDADGGNLKLVSATNNARSLGIAWSGGGVIDWLPDDGGHGAIMTTREFVPESSMGTRLASAERGLGVERIDTLSLARRTVEHGRPDAVEYMTDGRGTVRLMGLWPKTSTGYGGDRIQYAYRMANGSAWNPLGSIEASADGWTGFNPHAVDPALNVVYGFDDLDGRQAVYTIALDGTMNRRLVLANDKVDIDSLIRIGRRQRVVGASYVTDVRKTEFFDPELRKLAASLARALPRQPLVTFVDASADEGRLLLYAGSDVDPGRYYIYDKRTRRLEEVMGVRPQLAQMTPAIVKPVSFPAADGTMIPAYLTLPPGSDGKGLPAIVMPHGGPGARDEWGFDWWAQFFVARGFAVLQPNFRGSTGYGNAWFQKNGFQSWRVAIGDVNDAGRWLLKQGIANPDRLAIVGWSYGGYAALQSAALDPNLYKAIVAVAPVSDLEMLRTEARRYLNYRLVDRFIGQGPHIREGSPARNVPAIRVPVLMFHGDRDTNVGIAESRLMNDRLRTAGQKSELVEYKGLDHQLDASAARTDMLVRTDAFLRATLKM